MVLRRLFYCTVALEAENQENFLSCETSLFVATVKVGFLYIPCHTMHSVNAFLLYSYNNESLISSHFSTL